VPVYAEVAAAIAAFAHVIFFVLESLLFTQPRIAARFGLTTPEQFRAVRPMAFNQGFYKLFLALGAAGGVMLVLAGHREAGRAIAVFACGCMVGAGVVLLATSRHFVRPATIQIVPALLAVVGGLLG
jgi:putative membrane protein